MPIITINSPAAENARTGATLDRGISGIGSALYPNPMQQVALLYRKQMMEQKAAEEARKQQGGQQMGDAVTTASDGTLSLDGSKIPDLFRTGAVSPQAAPNILALANGGKSNLKPINDSEQKDISKKLTELQQLYAAQDALKANPNAIGLKNKLGVELPNTIDSIFGNIGNIDARAKVGQVRANKTFSRAGMGVTGNESGLTSPDTPQLTDQALAAQIKMTPYQQALENEVLGMQNVYSPSGGYREFPQLRDFFKNYQQNDGSNSGTTANSAQTQNVIQPADPISKARAAIASGADAAAVRQRLQQAGIDPSGL